jgi:hypothetical protein
MRCGFATHNALKGAAHILIHDRNDVLLLGFDLLWQGGWGIAQMPQGMQRKGVRKIGWMYNAF